MIQPSGFNFNQPEKPVKNFAYYVGRVFGWIIILTLAALILLGAVALGKLIITYLLL